MHPDSHLQSNPRWSHTDLSDHNTRILALDPPQSLALGQELVSAIGDLQDLEPIELEIWAGHSLREDASLWRFEDGAAEIGVIVRFGTSRGCGALDRLSLLREESEKADTACAHTEATAHAERPPS